jgi:hypothetical protein
MDNFPAASKYLENANNDRAESCLDHFETQWEQYEDKRFLICYSND